MHGLGLQQRACSCDPPTPVGTEPWPGFGDLAQSSSHQADVCSRCPHPVLRWAVWIRCSRFQVLAKGGELDGEMCFYFHPLQSHGLYLVTCSWYTGHCNRVTKGSIDHMQRHEASQAHHIVVIPGHLRAAVSRGSHLYCCPAPSSRPRPMR